MRRIAAPILCLLVLSACSREDDATPVGCLADDDAVLQALEKAPGKVRLEGTPLSECLSDTTDGEALQSVGAAYLNAATALADRATENPDGEAALQLGYLLGAVKRSEEGSQGIGYELGRRLRSEGARVEEGSEAFDRGVRAGTEGG